MSARNRATPIPDADRVQLAALVERRGGLIYTAAHLRIAPMTLRRALDGAAVMRPTHEAVTRGLVLEGAR